MKYSYRGPTCQSSKTHSATRVRLPRKEIREFSGAMFDSTGNLPPLPGIFPGYAAPIVRNQPSGRELMMARWGMPSPVFALKGRNSDAGVTNIRNTASPHWRRWLGPEHRCVVPFTSFSETNICRMVPNPRSGSPWTRHGHWRALPASGRGGVPCSR